MDEELNDLIEELDAADEPTILPPEPDPDSIEFPPDTPISLTTSEPPLRTELVSRPIIEEIRSLDAETPEGSSSPTVDLNKFVERYEVISKEILDCCRADRQEAQDAANLCRSQIDDILKTTNNPREVPRIYVESLVKAIEVKANINTNAVKIIDSGAKLIASIKSQININNTNNNLSVDKELSALLATPLDSEMD